MASIPLPTLYLSAKFSPISLRSTARNKSAFNSFAVKFTLLNSNPRSHKYVCRAASVVFRDLDADDFRHPLDRQVIDVIPWGTNFLPCSVFLSGTVDGFHDNFWTLRCLFVHQFIVVQNTLLLRAIPGLNEIGKALLGNLIPYHDQIRFWNTR